MFDMEELKVLGLTKGEIKVYSAILNIGISTLNNIHEKTGIERRAIYDIIIDGVYYHHGSGAGGLYPAFNKARNMGMSVVSGHIHAASGVWWTTSPKHRFFGMNVGSGIDVDQLTFDYGRHLVRRPVLSAAVVIDAIPTHVIMPCGPGERYHKRKRSR